MDINNYDVILEIKELKQISVSSETEEEAVRLAFDELYEINTELLNSYCEVSIMDVIQKN